MRILLSTALLAALAFPAVSFAQSAPAQTAPAQTAPGAAEPASPPAAAAPAHSAKPRQTLEQRFDAANTTHDGHLTQAQAGAAKWNYISKHFAAIDKGSKGYVTVDDIRAYAHAAHAARQANKPAAATN